MAITAENAKLLFYAKRLGVSYAKSLTLGRLELLATKKELSKLNTVFGTAPTDISTLNFKGKYAEPLFEMLGANIVDSIDYSAYEGATIIHDMNVAVPPKLVNKYSAIVDGGTLEHIFNFPIAIKSCMEMLEIGGHFISFTPANNTFGHGFYQFSPELFYRIFNSENGFKVKLIAAFTNEGSEWFEVADPEEVKGRVMLVNNKPTHLIVIAEKIAHKEIFSTSPYQSDYQYIWELNNANNKKIRFEKDSTILHYYKRIIPSDLRTILRRVYDFIFKRPRNINSLGYVNPAYFKKINIDE